MIHVHAEAEKNIKNAVGHDMKTVIRKLNNNENDNKFIEEAADILRKGGLVAFPTETVYGLGANGLSEAACKKIYEAKGRPSDNPLILHIGDICELDNIVAEVTPLAVKIMDKFWPGPLTLIFKKKPCVPNAVTGGLDTVGVRFPSNNMARKLIKKANVPVAAPSANSSGKPSPTRASHVEFDLTGKIDMILDGGAAEFGLESTIVDVTGESAVILRPGAITKEMLEKLLGKAEFDPAILQKPDSNFVPKAPGMKYTHYSPKASVVLVKGNSDAVVEKINSLTADEKMKGRKTGVLATDETKDCYEADFVLSAGSRENEIEIGANLFNMLRKFDHLGADVVFSEVFDESGEGTAIMNRLKKAAGYNFIEA